jgi:phosphoribosylaminoimidazole-succinocarboxamide synthase
MSHYFEGRWILVLNLGEPDHASASVKNCQELLEHEFDSRSFNLRQNRPGTTAESRALLVIEISCPDSSRFWVSQEQALKLQC